MRISCFDTELLENKPWKNGQGSTRDIACWPPGTDFTAFDWRVSIATIAANGPFSQFEGIDRTIVLLSGDGVRLRSSDGRVDHRLDTKWQSYDFAGETLIDCEMLGEQSRDLNVMTRRNVLRAETRVLRVRTALDPTPYGLLLVLQGMWCATQRESVHSVAAGSGLWWEGGSESSWLLTPDGAAGCDDSALMVVRWRPSS